MDIDEFALILANGDTGQAEIKSYYIKSMLHTASTFTAIATASYFLDVLQYALVIILTLRLFRTKTGGCHSKSITLCKVMSFLILVGLSLLVPVIKISNAAITIWTGCIALFGLYMIYKVVPIDTPQRPIISMEFRRKLKIEAYIFFLILIASVYLFCIYDYLRWGYAVLLALSLQLFLMTKLGFWVVNRVDNIFSVR